MPHSFDDLKSLVDSFGDGELTFIRVDGFDLEVSLLRAALKDIQTSAFLAGCGIEELPPSVALLARILSYSYFSKSYNAGLSDDKDNNNKPPST